MIIGKVVFVQRIPHSANIKYQEISRPRALAKYRFTKPEVSMWTYLKNPQHQIGGRSSRASEWISRSPIKLIATVELRSGAIGLNQVNETDNIEERAKLNESRGASKGGLVQQ
jgi:hypothetical protein